jgi:N-methylhydantoinase B
VLIRCAGSGGYGDPLEREVERVLQDVVDGYITPQAAHDLYGVILREGRVDPSATTAQRAHIRQSRPSL